MNDLVDGVCGDNVFSCHLMYSICRLLHKQRLFLSLLLKFLSVPKGRRLERQSGFERQTHCHYFVNTGSGFIMLGPCSVVVVLCVIGAITEIGAQEWIRHLISCDFENGQCGWHDNGNTTLRWTKDHKLLGNDHWMALDMDNARVNDSGLLSSPPLHGSLNQTCRLSFTRHIKSNNHACQLTVFMVTGTNWTSLWRTSDITGGALGISWHSEGSPGLQWSCTEPNFKIVFEGRKIGSGSCGGTEDVDDIEFYTKQLQHRLTSIAMPTTSTPSTAMTSQIITVSTMLQSTEPPQPHSEISTASEESNSTTLSTSNFEEFKDTGLSSGAVAAIVVVVIAVVVIVSLILILLFLRRRAREQGKEDHWVFTLCRKRPKKPLPGSSAAFTNSSYVLNTQSQANGEGSSSTSHRGGHAASVQVYSTADDAGYELSSPTPHTYTNTTAQDDYNVLSRKDPPGPPSDNLYNHLNGHSDGRFQHSKATADQDANSYSLAKPRDASSTANTTATPRTATDYEVVNGKRNEAASSPSASPDTYNTLGETVGDSRDDNPQNHYDHFHDTDEQYSSTDMQERTRDQQRKMAADLYSHAQ